MMRKLEKFHKNLLDYIQFLFKKDLNLIKKVLFIVKNEKFR